MKLGDVFGGDVPADADRRVRSVTLRELLTMTAGFGSTATDPFGDGGNAYRTTPNWVILGSPLASQHAGRDGADVGPPRAAGARVTASRPFSPEATPTQS